VTRRGRILLFVALVGLGIGCDHTAKRIAVRTLGGAPVSLAGDVLQLQLAHNPGAFLGVGDELPAAVRHGVLLVLVPLGLVAFCAVVWRLGASSPQSLLGLALVVGGGLGNWIDRVLHGGAVTDFVSLGLGPLRSGIFNLADVWIVAGVVLLLLAHRERPAPGPGSG
jgi:signal peptidase II